MARLESCDERQRALEDPDHYKPVCTMSIGRPIATTALRGIHLFVATTPENPNRVTCVTFHNSARTTIVQASQVEDQSVSTAG